MRQVRTYPRPRASTPAAADLRPLLRQDPTTPLPEGRCIFWTLPTELREMIYSYAWRDQSIIVGRVALAENGKWKLRGRRQRHSPERHGTGRATAYLNDLLVSKAFHHEAKDSMLRDGNVVLKDKLFDIQIRQLVRCRSARWAMKHMQSIEVTAEVLYSREFTPKHFPQLRQIRIVDCRITHFGLKVIFGRSEMPLDVEHCWDLQRVEQLEDCEFLQQLARFTTLRTIKFVLPDCTICDGYNRDMWQHRPESDSECHLSRTLALSMEMYVLSNILARVQSRENHNSTQVRQLVEEVSDRRDIVTRVVGETIEDGFEEEIEAMGILWPPSYE